MDDVSDFLRSIKLDQYIEQFMKEDVDGKMLADIVKNEKNSVLECLCVTNPLHVQKIYSKFSSFCYNYKD